MQAEPSSNPDSTNSLPARVDFAVPRARDAGTTRNSGSASSDNADKEDQAMSTSASSATALRFRPERDVGSPQVADASDTVPEIAHLPILTWRDRMKHFTWTWFTLSMATGGIAHVLHTGMYFLASCRSGICAEWSKQFPFDSTVSTQSA